MSSKSKKSPKPQRSSRKSKRQKKPRVYVELTAFWGNDCVDSTIKVSRRRWAQIKLGAEYRHNTWSYYEGVRQHTRWHFKDSMVSIGYGNDLAEAIRDMPVEELAIHER